MKLVQELHQELQNRNGSSIRLVEDDEMEDVTPMEEQLPRVFIYLNNISLI
jgi:hypothetical protein